MTKTTTPVEPTPLASTTPAGRAGISLYRCQMLAYNLVAVAGRLLRGQPHDAPGEHLDDYLRLGWLRWDAEGARLRLTPEGAKVGSSAA